MSFLRALGRAAARLGRRTERTAAAASVVQGAAPGAPPVNAAGVRVALDEVGAAERERPPASGV